MVLSNGSDDGELQDLLDLLTCHRPVFWLEFVFKNVVQWPHLFMEIYFTPIEWNLSNHFRLLWAPMLGKHIEHLVRSWKRMSIINPLVTLVRLVVVLWIGALGIKAVARAIVQGNHSQYHTCKMRTSWNWIVPGKSLKEWIKKHICRTSFQSLGPQLAGS